MKNVSHLFKKEKMGIKNLNKFLRTVCPHVFEEVHLAEYAFQKVAIDISLYLCKYKASAGERWLSSFINLIACLRKNEIHCVFIFDTGSPPEKEKEKEERKAQRDLLEERIYKLEEALEKYHETCEVDPILIEFYNKKKAKKPKRLMRKGKQTDEINMELVADLIKKKKSQILNISQKDFDTAKELFDILDVPYCQAPLEAETMCADLCKRGLVDAVLSEDTDVLAYGAPVFLTKIDTRAETCVRIRHEDVTGSLEFTEDQFLDFCIMCGTDYNKNIFRVGPQKSYKLMQEYGSIESIGENSKHDIAILSHVRGRELFKDYEKANIKIPYCGQPDFNKLQEFVFKKNVRSNMEALRQSFTHQSLVFESSEGEIEKEETEETEEKEVCV